MNSLLFIIWLVGFSYFFLILKFLLVLPKNLLEKEERKHKKSISVIIPVRNEALHLKPFLESIIQQSYPRDFFKIYFINDHSTDNTKEILENFSFENQELNIEIIDLKETKGKKAALQKAYQLATSELILTTDADCILPGNWIEIANRAFDNEEVQMLCGGVKIPSGKSWLEQFQSVELMSLAGSGAAGITLKKPFMSNGANLAYRRTVLKNIDFSQMKPQTPSGDDVFLLMEVLKKFGPKAIQFEFHPSHWVETKALSTFEQLVQQRIRWTSKSKNYTQPFQIFVSMLVLLSNLGIPILFLWSLFSLDITMSFLFYWFMKMMIDFVFIKKIAHISRQTFTFPMYMNTAIIYPFFISYIAIIGQFAGFSWKERKYSGR